MNAEFAALRTNFDFKDVRPKDPTILAYNKPSRHAASQEEQFTRVKPPNLEVSFYAVDDDTFRRLRLLLLRVSWGPLLGWGFTEVGLKGWWVEATAGEKGMP